MHGGFIRENFTTLVVSVPAATGMTFEISGVPIDGRSGMAVKTAKVAVSSEEDRHVAD